MQEQQLQENGKQGNATSQDNFRVASPNITLPKGGGAVRGMGEKFSANPVTGTGSMSVPIATSPGRSGFGLQLSISYDSGAGNGIFGFGWSLSIPSITRKTDKGLPQYHDAENSDIFILSGAEDLVPSLEPDQIITVDAETYQVRRYRPRIEGLFARIERWTQQSTNDVHWRSISKDNILTLYGKDQDSRIADPENPLHIFSWLICETRDDKGNAVIYTYKPDDDVGVKLAQVHERNREAHSRTTNRYLKRIHYGNRTTALDDKSQRPFILSPRTDWMFEVVFDYGEHTADLLTPNEDGAWGFRLDPFSSYRSGFEVRTTRLCRRVLMFHHIPDLPNQPNSGYEGLVRSTDFAYSDPASVSAPIYTFLKKVTQTGYKPNGNGYLSRSLPPVEFDYSQPMVQDTVETVESASLENLPIGLDGASYQWIDLHGEGIPGILTEQANAWYYKRNVSPIHDGVKFAPLERVALKPNLSFAANAQIMDLAGDGQPDLVVLDDPMPGFYEHNGEEGWQPFRPFTSRLNRTMRDPNLKFIDLDGDGHADVLISEDNALVWHASLAEQGFGPARRVAQALDEEKGPRLVFADMTQSIYLADLSGDGLTDLVRIRNGEVCYWPNLGYCRFGAKITMDNSPWFDNPDQFDQKRIRLADIDGSGTTDLIYLHRDGVKLYFNQSGNGWSGAQALSIFPAIDDIASVMTVDLLGNGTACLVWSSPLPAHFGQQMRYVNLMGGQKPHLLINTRNNLGAETRVYYAPSTKFYLQDKKNGKPWITKLPFPVHVVERVETYDHISRNRFATRYAYHHGYFDGDEREFRGFGMVEQWDTEEFTALTASSALPVGDNINAASHVPPVLTRTWFHTGFYLDKQHISQLFALEYYREPGLSDEQFHAQLLADTLFPVGLGIVEEREACRTLKGAMLRQEVYALDGTPAALHPYSVIEQNFTIQRLQDRSSNCHAVFFTHPHEAITYHYERNPSDPRIQHVLTLEVDTFGNVQKALAIGYGRRQADNSLPAPEDQHKQTQTPITYTDGLFTNVVNEEYDYRTPLPAAVRTYELSGFTVPTPSERFRFADWERNGFAWLDALEEIQYEAIPSTTSQQKRLIEHVQTRYRKNDLSEPLLTLGLVESLALPGESYKLAFTPGLLAQAFQRNGQALLPDLATVLGGNGGDQGGYVDLERNGQWWLSSGRSFFHPDYVPAADELAEARSHFFLPRRYRDPFGQDAVVDFAHDLLMVETRDALGNRMTVEANDYRVLQPRLVSDPNRNQTAVVFDALGMVAGTAVMGKANSIPVEGDNLTGFIADLEQTQIDPFVAAPRQSLDQTKSQAAPIVHTLLQGATTRIVYDLHRFMRESKPPFAATIARETHVSDLDLAAGEQSPLQISFSYSDGFGREIQKKIQAEPGVIVAGEPVTNPRWVGSGWTIFNNKGKPVRQYEPFFSATHDFEFGNAVGVSSVLFYDPAGRVIATLHPNHTFEKVLFDPWQQTTWDVNDTVLLDPRTDDDIASYVKEYFKTEPADWKTWHQQRIDGTQGTHEQQAAKQTEAHADTPTVAHFDSLGRPFLTLAHNKVVCKDHELDGTADTFATRVELDIEGNQREVRDAIVQAGDPLGRVVMRYAYDMLGNRIYQASMEAGERWMLNDVTGKAIRAWDSRGHNFTTRYDVLRRPLEQYVMGTSADSDPRTLNRSLLVDRVEYGESAPQHLNLRTRVHKHSDSAGIVVNEAHDFKGNLLRSSRQLVTDYKGIPDWANNPALATEVFQSSTRYDALSRPVQSIAPHATASGINVIQAVFNEANLLDKVEVWLGQATEPTGVLNAATTPPAAALGVANIDYNAKGQRQRIDYKNGASTFYEYDPLTFRLTRLLTRRNAANFPGDDPSPPIADCPGRYLQNLHYTYDPVGNITHIHDDAQQTIYFRNKCVDPSNDYAYDALYRLIEAHGREHLGQGGGAPIPHSYNDAPRVGLQHPGDGNAMGRYVERYVYDGVGNFLQMQHRGADSTHAGWTRTYDYQEASLTEAGKHSNRLTKTTVGNGHSAIEEQYTHDAHGNMLQMPQLQTMAWDYKDQLRISQRQKVNADDTEGDRKQGEHTYYVYDASGQRIRKVTELANGNLKDERIYLGGFEIYRQHSGTHAGLERETLHIMDDKQRIALVETRNHIDDGSSKQLIRYQHGNHLGSASLELDDQAQIISYEEYSPYGSSTYQAVRNQTEAAKRYRYTGKERDEETGLYYHGARYYAACLGRWTSADPIGIKDGNNIFAYVQGNPIRYTDPDGKAVNLAAGGIGALVGGISGAAIGAWSAKPGERWAAAGKGAAIGAGTGALAGLTFGASLAATGAVGIGGATLTTGGTTGSVLVASTVAGAVGGGTGSVLSALSEGASGQEAWEMGTIGAFTGSVGGALGGASGIVSSNLTRAAGASQLVSYSIGGATGGAIGDVGTQTVSMLGGVQEEFSPVQLLVATSGGGASGAFVSKVQAKADRRAAARADRRAAARDVTERAMQEMGAEWHARKLYMEIRRTGSKTLNEKTKVIVGMVDRKSRTVTAERNGQKGLGPATDIKSVLARALETCAENACVVKANKRGDFVGEGENVTFFAIEANPSMLPKRACLNCQAQFPKANFASGKD